MGEVLTPVASESAAAYLEELLAGRRLGFAAVCNLRLSSGAKRRVRVLAGTLRYGNLGSPLHVLVLEDATSAEAEELGMRERERRLLLAQRRDSMSQLAGGLAHEYNNALAAIAGLASLLRDDLPPGDARRADAEDIIVVAQSASDLTRRLLDLSAGRLSERATLDLREVLRGFVAVLRRVLPSTIDVRVDLPSAAVPATIDRTQVEQALFGLVLNARDAMPAGGRLDLSLERVQAADGVPRARIGIADTGPGISALVRERLWTPFFSTKPDGAGLGLSFGLAVLREHGGDLRLESPPENGAVFGAYLPVAVAPDGAGTSAAAAPAAAEPQGRRVLLVEDERLVRATTARVLSKAGYTVTVAVDGEEALRLFEQAPDLVDVLVTDLQMPRIAGVDLVNRVRRLRPQLPVVVTSAHPAAEDDDRVLRAQRTARLRKPFPMAALLETLAQVLDEGGKG
jgi:signal transduction histidine kinase/CheY-like chemotaxis protein